MTPTDRMTIGAAEADAGLVITSVFLSSICTKIPRAIRAIPQSCREGKQNISMVMMRSRETAMYEKWCLLLPGCVPDEAR